MEYPSSEEQQWPDIGAAIVGVGEAARLLEPGDGRQQRMDELIDELGLRDLEIVVRSPEWFVGDVGPKGIPEKFEHRSTDDGPALLSGWVEGIFMLGWPDDERLHGQPTLMLSFPLPPDNATGREAGCYLIPLPKAMSDDFQVEVCPKVEAEEEPYRERRTETEWLEDLLDTIAELNEYIDDLMEDEPRQPLYNIGILALEWAADASQQLLDDADYPLLIKAPTALYAEVMGSAVIEAEDILQVGYFEGLTVTFEPGYDTDDELVQPVETMIMVRFPEDPGIYYISSYDAEINIPLT